jgi:2-iminobutanoate/2-iminopropanoate deaminase
MWKGINMKPSVVSTDRAPSSSAPLSQGVRYGDFLFVSGQVPVDPATSKMVEGDISEQTRRVMENIRGIVEAAGGSMDNVLKTTCFLVNMDEFAGFNEVYRSYFSERLPARSTFEVSRLAAGFQVEVEAIVCIPSEG